MLKRVLCFTIKHSGDGGAVTWSLQKVQEVRWASVSILYRTLGFDSSETYAAWQVSPHLIYVALSFNAYGPGKGCTAVGWLLLSITGCLFPDSWFSCRTISGFSVPEILKTAESLKIWVLNHFEIVIVRYDGLQCSYPWWSHFKVIRVTTEEVAEDPGVWAKLKIVLFPQWPPQKTLLQHHTCTGFCQ